MELLQLDLNVHASWQVQLHQRINGLVRWVDDVDQALMGADLELVATGLVDVRRTQDVKALHARWQWNRSLDDGAGAFCGVNDFQSRLIDQLVIKRLEADADFLLLHVVPAPTCRQALSS